MAGRIFASRLAWVTLVVILVCSLSVSNAAPAAGAGAKTIPTTIPTRQARVARAGVTDVSRLAHDFHAGVWRALPPLRPDVGQRFMTHAGREATANLAAAAIAVGTRLPQALASSDNGIGLTPPDMALAVGGGKEVQMVNLVGRIWAGATPGAVFALSSFFQSGSNAFSDPWVLFDQPSGRFFAGIFDITLGGEDLAASQTSDPGGLWNVYHVRYPSSAVTAGGCPDQGKGGVDNNVVALGFNVFSVNGCQGGTFLGAAVEIFNKSEMRSGSSLDLSYTDPMSNDFSLIPAQSLSSTATERFASLDAGSGTVVHRLNSTGVPGTGTVRFTTPSDVSIGAYADPPAASQRGTTVTLDAGDDRVQHVVYRSNILALSATDSCIPPGDSSARACARIVAIDVRSSTAKENVDLSNANHHYFYPAVTLNSTGQLVATFGESSSSMYPRLLASAGAVGGAFAVPVTVQSGSRSNISHRYGDYFAVAVDPDVSTNVWVAGEVGGPQSGASAWNTAVAEVLVT